MFLENAKQHPKVSVVITTYNRANLIGRAIESIFRQTYKDYEIIVVDDGSSDNTREVVEGFRDNRIHYIRHHENRGCSAGRNTGIKASKSDYIAFLDTDDEWLPEKLEKQVYLLERANSGIDAVYTAMLYVERNRKHLVPQLSIKNKEANIGDLILKRSVIAPSTVLIKKHCFDRVGLFDEKLRWGDDWDMWIRVTQGYEFAFISEPLVVYRQQPDSLTTDRFASERSRACEVILRKHYARYSKNHNAIGEMCFSIGHNYCIAGDMKKGREWIIKSFKWEFISIKRVISIAISFLGRGAYAKASRFKYKLFLGREFGPLYFFLSR